MSTGVRRAIAASLLLALGLPTGAAPAAGPAVEHFEKQVRPLVHETCAKCHGPEKHKRGPRLEFRLTDVHGQVLHPILE
jgi:hypothetical protein